MDYAMLTKVKAIQDAYTVCRKLGIKLATDPRKMIRLAQPVIQTDGITMDHPMSFYYPVSASKIYGGSPFIYWKTATPFGSLYHEIGHALDECLFGTTRGDLLREEFVANLFARHFDVSQEYRKHSNRSYNSYAKHWMYAIYSAPNFETCKWQVREMLKEFNRLVR